MNALVEIDPKSFAETIKPSQKGVSGKYSWRLYRRALKNGRERVYLMAWNAMYGYQKPDIEKLKADAMQSDMIAFGRLSDDGWFSGKRLSEVCRDGAPTSDWAYPPAYHTSEWIDITDWFWSEYITKGRCRFIYRTHTFQKINRNSRKCTHCGTHQHRTIVTEKTIRRNEVWA